MGAGHWEIDPGTLSVDIIDTRREAAPFVREHHYAGAMPVARLSVGLFANGRGGRSALVGVCVFSPPVNNASAPNTAGLGYPPPACALGRRRLLNRERTSAGLGKRG